MSNLPEKAIQTLLVEDDPDAAYLICMALAEADTSSQFGLKHVTRLDEALNVISSQAIDVIILDLSLPDASGLESLEMIRETAPGIPVIVLTALNDEDTAMTALKKGAQDYIVKGPIDPTLLVRTIRYALERDRAQRELRSANVQLKNLIRLDPLTEMLNRRGLEDILTREMNWLQRDGSDLLVLLIDMDDFKQINDRLGHSVGDIVLKEIARKLRQSLRATDYVARIGGDEFMALLPRTRPAEGLHVAERVRLSISGTPISLSRGETVKVTASLGLVNAFQKTPSIDELLAQTHGVLYQSKQEGKNRVSYASSGSLPKDGESVLDEIVSKLRQGEGLFSLGHPIMNLQNGTEIGYEMLARSSHKVFGMPDDFFRLCLESNILTVVDHHCMKIAVQTAAKLEPNLLRHLNLFPSTMIDIATSHLIENIREHDPEGKYCIEISEQQIIGDPSYLAGAVETFKKAGIQVAIDDVGFGRSCLESLIVLEPDIVKIDKKLVMGIGTDSGSARSLHRLLRMLDSLGPNVVAEGIETEQDRQALQEMGVLFGQGYLWGKPAPLNVDLSPKL